MPYDVMLDIETLGTKMGSVILSVAFIPFKENDVGYVSNLNVDDQLKAGMEINYETVKWWFSDDKVESLIRSIKNPQPVLKVLEEIEDFVSIKEFTLWSHGANFDEPMLNTLFSAFGKRAPWSHRSVRDTRTIFDLAGVDYSRDFCLTQDKQHTAVDDAKNQIKAVKFALSTLNMVR